jgi:hypothetical protein
MHIRHSFIVVVALTALLSADPASAYVDPGTGSMLAQLVLGGVSAAVLLPVILILAPLNDVVFPNVDDRPAALVDIGPMGRRQ